MSDNRSLRKRMVNRWKYMDSMYKSVLVGCGGLILVAILGVGVSAHFFGVDGVEHESPDLSTGMDCTIEGQCSFDVIVNSTGDADGVAVAYKPTGKNTSETIALEEKESAEFSANTTVAIYTQHGDASKLHSTYQPMENPTGSTGDGSPQVGAIYDQSGNAAGNGTNVTVTLTSLEGADAVTLDGGDSPQTLTTGETVEFVGLNGGTSLTLSVDHDGKEATVQTYTVLVSDSTDWSGSPMGGSAPPLS